MVDTIKLWYPYPPNKKIIEALKNSYDVISHTTGEVSVGGHHANLKIYVKDYGVKIEGSLCKFYKGSNALEFTRDEVKKAIEKLSDHLHMNIDEATVQRFDIGSNLIMNEPVGTYLGICGEPRATGRYKIARFDEETVMYMNDRRTITLYDKVRERKGEITFPLEVLQGKHILRCEVQFKRRVAEQLKEPVTAALLYDPRFYKKALGIWEDELLGIKLKRHLKLNREVNMKDFINYLALCGMESLGGEEVCLPMLKQASKNGTLNRQQYKRLKDKIRSLKTHEGLTEEIEAAKELRQKIKAAAMYHRLF